jgi:leucyl aminopeptidase
MQLQFRNDPIERIQAGAIVLGILEGTKRPSGAARAVDRAAGGVISACLSNGDFSGKREQAIVLYPKGRARAKRIVLVGLGSEKDLTVERVRQAAGRAMMKARELGVGDVATVVHGGGAGGIDVAACAQAVVEGSMLANYSYDRYRTRDKSKSKLVKTLVIAEADVKKMAEVKRGAARGKAGAEAVTFVRDLCNTPSLDMTPRQVAESALTLADKEAKITVKSLDENECKKLKMGSFLGVAKGSDEPPRLLVLEYVPEGKPTGTVCLVGKGITFDTGGISLKPAEGMEKMKYDMSGAAAVLGVFHALKRVRPSVRVIGLAPMTENMPGGHAIKPGDVLIAMNGITIEVNNTDAEGRLVLADGIAYAKRFYKPDAIIDIATLTGAVVIALGGQASGVMGNDSALMNRVKAASDRSGERVWELPTWPEYNELIRSDIADQKNSGGREAGTIVGAMFLAPFAENTPWVHMDIAGTAWNDKDKPYAPKGSSGVAVRLLLDLLENWQPNGSARSSR